jgi:hypothetical protein
MIKIKAKWSGFSGAPGWSNFFFDTGTADFHTPEHALNAATRVKDFFTVNSAYFPSGVSIAIQPDAEVINAGTGKLETVVPAGTIAPIAGAGAAGDKYSGASGIVVTWRTAGVRNGRRVRGRTFLVPVVSGAYDSNGTLGATAITNFQTAGTALLTPPAGQLPLGVWARPTTKGGTDGAWHKVTTCSVPDLAAVLRSRR